jgi:hypothetical protein
MSITFTDDDLHSWEAFASGGDFGLAIHPRVVFNCLSDPHRRPRFVEVPGDEADAENLVHEGGIDQLRAMLKDSQEIE